MTTPRLATLPHAAMHRWPRMLLLLLLLGWTACAGTDDHDDDHDHTDAEASAEEHDTVDLDSIGIRLAGIRIDTAEAVIIGGLAATGTVTWDANRVSHVGTRVEGRIVALHADIGQRVTADQVLALLESPEVGRLRAAAREADDLVRIAREHHAREERLERLGIASRKELLEAEAELRRAEAALRSAEEGLRVFGAGPGAGSQVAVVSPLAGSVVARGEFHLGEMTTPTAPLFVVADLSQVWIELDVYERDLSRVRVGQQVTVSVAAYPEQTFTGRVSRIGDLVESATQTVRVRVDVANPRGVLKPGMFARAQIRVEADGATIAAVPQRAVQELEGRRVVFVPGDHAGEFRAVTVDVGDLLDGGRVIILAGLRPGEPVVVAGAFTLRAELAKGEIGGHSH